VATASAGAAAAKSVSEARRRVAASTVEALMYSLRSRGVAALAEPDCQRRLSELNDDQVREVSTHLQKLKPEIAQAWSPEELRRLAMIWKKGKLYD
jgi:hypothetical protein